MTIKYLDKDNNEVYLNYTTDKDEANGQHVLIIPIYNNKLLFTQHDIRGIEFPGGKIEENESSLAAAQRELNEETGAVATELHYIAQYYVARQNLPSFYKDVYVAKIDYLENKQDYLETSGPKFFSKVTDIPEQQRSFLIKDTTILNCLERVIELGYYK
ncbi:RNA deprotection pyrophosphohydrolase [Staphylococcus kloosii]|jgi:8-oxo-dGTP diphosphatase|uniref:Nucleoside triphosphatase YtkD n=1 Tax=Staphylococcus kloosii TaxID=29384 RepID=A0A151A4M8_9STAP|nr:nucleoside triphosphatase YtkD [Staphylococcus kloosii]AVQ35879.1 nucleoside triphosphatase YtkD [Staphylococcus kloosii]KYH14185.1 nucleoside triphosphatase YtkD [Staphylococcus kloosii]MBF7021770.1 nucleoside triphosphatase YtkD [Staphylococcus kloosii]PNZ04967.1 nucleoside triphosphatase YtkD [Staphylococcus kloosii]PTJ75477.1 nucleoside triphosphatase YtkD [Staphylococcus kloosii]